MVHRAAGTGRRSPENLHDTGSSTATRHAQLRRDARARTSKRLKHDPEKMAAPVKAGAAPTKGGRVVWRSIGQMPRATRTAGVRLKLQASVLEVHDLARYGSDLFTVLKASHLPLSLSRLLPLKS